MDGKHSKPSNAGESFDAQWDYSVASAAAKGEPSLQEKVDSSMAGRQEIADENQEG